MPGFPDLFVLTGRGCPAGLSDLTLAAEQQVNWLMELLAHYRERGVRTVEARADAAQAWTRRVDEAARATLFPRADSWYLGADVSGKPRVFMPYIGDFRPYADRCDDDRDRGYAGWHVGDVTTADAEALAGPAQRAAGTVRGGPWTTT